MPDSVVWIVQLLLIPFLSPFFIGVTRKLKARMQNRQGASCFQPYRDLWKLFQKDEIISHDASWIFRVAPYLIFASTLAIAVSIPVLSTAAVNSLTGDFIVVIYLFAFGAFFLALAGMDVGSPFGGFGSSREMTVAALTEGGLLMSMLALALIARSTNLTLMSETVASLEFANFAPIILAFIGFSIALLAETCRYPFDNPSTHLELTMIHEAMLLEYSGKRLALMEWAAANKYLLFICLGSNLFIPWGIAGSHDFASLSIAFGMIIGKALLFCGLVAVIESTMAKFRFFRLPDLLYTSFALSVIAIGLTI